MSASFRPATVCIVSHWTCRAVPSSSPSRTSTVRQESGRLFHSNLPAAGTPHRYRDRHKSPSAAVHAYNCVLEAYQSHLQSTQTLTPSRWSKLCSALLAKPSAAQLDTWNLVQKAAADAANASPIILSSINDLLPLYTRSARRGDHAIVSQIARYCQAHFAAHPRTLAMADVDPLFFKVMVASEDDMGTLLPKATKAVARWMQTHQPSPEPEHVAFYLSLVSKQASKAHVEQLVSALTAGSNRVKSPVIASALISLYSRTCSPNLGLQVWDKCVASDPPIMSAAMAASYCDLLGFHWRNLDDVQMRLASVHAQLASGSPPFTLALATNANVWTSLLEAVIRANLSNMVVPVLRDMQERLRGQAGVRKAVLTVGSMMKQKLGDEEWDKQVRDEIGKMVNEFWQLARSPSRQMFL